MRIKKLNLNGFHNLKNVNCLFTESKVIGFIGDNGSGKSSILEGINDAFYIAMNIDRVEPSYAFDITYNINDDVYRFENQRLTFFKYKNGSKVYKEKDFSMPQAIFTYYAGETERLNRFANMYKEEAKSYIASIKNESTVSSLKFSTTFSLKDFKLAFFVNYIFNTECYHLIKDNYLKFDSVTKNIIFKLKKPSWASVSAKKDNLWNAKGFQKTFYDQLLKNNDEYGSGAFVRLDDDAEYYQDEIWLGLFHEDLLKKIVDTPLDLFIKLKALYEVDLLDEIFISVTKEVNSPDYDIDLFSEGEKQIANLIMLLTLTKDYEAIYLLDEFDAYLHPNWQRDFVNIISQIDVKGQIFFTTHSPATISGMRSENVFVMRDGQVKPANSETYNRSLDEIMEENMYISMRPQVFVDLEREFRNAIIHGNKELALKKLEQIKEIVGEKDPFFITASIVLERI